MRFILKVLHCLKFFSKSYDKIFGSDMPILELLGSSETGGPQTACLPGAGMRVGSVGRSYPHFETVVSRECY